MNQIIKTTIALLLVSGFIWTMPHGVLAQEAPQAFTLEQAQKFALENSFSSQLAAQDVEMAMRQTKQLRAAGLPQINGKVDYQQFLEIPTQLLPGEIAGAPAGTFVPVQFGTEFNVIASATVSQLIFDGSYFVGLQAAKAFAQFTQEQKALTEAEIVNQVTQAYYMVITARENVQLISDSRGLLQTTLEETTVLYNNGFVEKQDVDQLELSLQDLDNRIEYAENQVLLAMRLLKFQMGLEQESDLILADGIDALVEQQDALALLSQPFDIQKDLGFQLASSGIGLQELQVKLQKSKVLPSLSAFYNYQENAQRTEFNFLDNNELWFPTQLLGITLNVPIFSGLGRYQSTEIAKIELEKAQIQQQQAARASELEYETARTELAFAFENKTSLKRSMDLAESIFNTAQIKYKEGVGSSFELTQAKNQMLSKQGEYINSVLQVLNAKNRLNKALSNY